MVFFCIIYPYWDINHAARDFSNLDLLHLEDPFSIQDPPGNLTVTSHITNGL